MKTISLSFALVLGLAAPVFAQEDAPEKPKVAPLSFVIEKEVETTAKETPKAPTELLVEKEAAPEAAPEIAPEVVIDKKGAKAKDKEGLKLLRAGKIFDAVDAFAEAVSLNPKRASYHNHYGLALFRTGDYYMAAEEYQAALKLGLNTDYLWNNLGMAYEYQDSLKEARNAYRRADQKGSPHAAKHLKRLEGVESVYPRDLGCGG